MITHYATRSGRDVDGLPRLAKSFSQADLAAAVDELLDASHASAAARQD